MSDDELTEKILDSIKTGLRNAIQTDIYKDNQSPEERKLNNQLIKIQQEIKDLLNEYGINEPITFDLVKKDNDIRKRYFNDHFPVYDVYGYKPPHKDRLVVTEFTVNPKKSYKFITFGSDKALFDDFIDKQDAVDFCKVVYRAIRNMQLL